ncbi:MAG: hypothetical protein ACLTZY_05195 [Alistipes indistinctus]
MKKLLLLAVLGAVTLLGSCIRPEKLSFEGIESIQVKGATASQVGIDLGIKATNASGSNLTLTDMQLTISKEGRRIVDIVLRDKVRLPRKSSGVADLAAGHPLRRPARRIGGLFRILERIAEHHPVGLRDSPGGLGQKKDRNPGNAA